MTDPANTIGGQLAAVGEPIKDPLTARLSKEIITLLSEQLYQSPTKAVEELVVNSFDADAGACPGSLSLRRPLAQTQENYH